LPPLERFLRLDDAEADWGRCSTGRIRGVDTLLLVRTRPPALGPALRGRCTAALLGRTGVVALVVVVLVLVGAMAVVRGEGASHSVGTPGCFEPGCGHEGNFSSRPWWGWCFRPRLLLLGAPLRVRDARDRLPSADVGLPRLDRLLLRGVTTAATAGSSEFSPPAPPVPPVPCAACPPSDAWLDEKEVRPSDPERRCGAAD
jgi:hypothetical protein